MHDRVAVGQPEQQLDQLPRADHLRDQVEQHHRQRAERREQPHRRLREAERGDVGEGVAAEVAEPLGQQEQDDRPADQEAGRVDQPVIAVGEDLRRDAEEGGRRHVVAGDRQAVLEAGDAAAGRVEIGRGLGPPRRPAGDAQRQQHERARTSGSPASWSPAARPRRSAHRPARSDGRISAIAIKAVRCGMPHHGSDPSQISRTTGSNSLLARRT